MKKLFLLILMSQAMCAQKVYDFDYLLELENILDLDQDLDHPKNDTISFVLLNSKKNDYYCFVEHSDSIYYKLKLKHIDNFSSYLKGKKVDINKAETINISCESLSKHTNQYKYKTKEYDYINLKDTLIDGALFYHYALKSNKSIKYQKRKKIYSLHFIVDKNSPEYKPFLHHQTAYEEWKKEKNIPNGILKMMYYVNLNNEIVKKHVVKNIIKTDKKIVISKDCEVLKN